VIFFTFLVAILDYAPSFEISKWPWPSICSYTPTEGFCREWRNVPWFWTILWNFRVYLLDYTDRRIRHHWALNQCTCSQIYFHSFFSLISCFLCNKSIKMTLYVVVYKRWGSHPFFFFPFILCCNRLHG